MPPSRPSLTNQVSLIVLWFFLHHLPSSHHQVVQTGYVFLIFVVVSVVFSVVSVLTFFYSYRLGLYTNHDLLYIIFFSFLSFFLSFFFRSAICHFYQPKLWISFVEMRKAFLGLANMYRNMPSLRMCTHRQILLVYYLFVVRNNKLNLSYLLNDV